MSSTFKNRIPKRKYRERAQLASRENLGLLEKKQDYQARARHHHQKEKMMHSLQAKARTKNQDQFYFRMLKGKRETDGKFVEHSESDSDFDQKQYRSSLKTENYAIVTQQKAIAGKKAERLKNDLHMISHEKANKHMIFIDSEASINDFEEHLHFKTKKELVEANLLDVSSKMMDEKALAQQTPSLKNKYKRLSECMEKEKMLTKLMLKIGYEKNLLGKERSMIKKFKGKKIHKFFIERKK